MPVGRACCSAHRCSAIECASCTWRYSLPMTRRILACEPRSLHAVMITCAASNPADFRRWRRSLHNAVTYHRRRSRWWSSVGLWGWWNGTGLDGLVELGSVTATEFAGALRRHGDVRLRPIGIDVVRTEVYRAAQSVSTSQRGDAGGRYQPVKIAIAPVTAYFLTNGHIKPAWIEPLPLIC